jgi:RNA polymerase sigma-70 factor (ECF subfamily)
VAVEHEQSERTKDDAELVRRALKDDQTAINQLHKKYKDSIYMVTLKIVHNREDAEDVTATAFSKAFLNLAKFSFDFAFSTWLHRIATNTSIDFLRKKRLHAVSLDATTTGEEGESTSIEVKDTKLDPEADMVKTQRKAMIRIVISSLKPNYQELIEMFYFQEKSYDEIEKETGLPLGTIKAQLFRAKEALFKEMKSKNLDNIY